jgi:hypothetical protein
MKRESRGREGGGGGGTCGARRLFTVGTVFSILLVLSDGFALRATSPALISLAREFYDAWNHGDIHRAAQRLAPDVEFWDANNSEPFRGRAATTKYLEDCADALPGWQFIITDYAEDAERNRLALTWHVVDSEQRALPFPTKGLSFIVFNDLGQMQFCTDVPEPTVKAGPLQLPLLKFITKALVRRT